MKNVKKLLAGLLITVGVVVGCASCGGNEKPVEETKVEQQEVVKEEKVTVQLAKDTIKTSTLPFVLEGLDTISKSSFEVADGTISVDEYNHIALDIEHQLMTRYLIPEETIALAENEEAKKIMLQNNKVVEMMAQSCRLTREGLKKGDTKKIDKGIKIIKKTGEEGVKLVEMVK